MEYFVQAVPAFGGSGPVWIGYADDPTKPGRLLKLVNRALTKVQPSVRRHETAMVIVTRRGDQKDLVSDDVPTLAEAFQRAEAIVSQIEAGTFRGRPYRHLRAVRLTISTPPSGLPKRRR